MEQFRQQRVHTDLLSLPRQVGSHWLIQVRLQKNITLIGNHLRRRLIPRNFPQDLPCTPLFGEGFLRHESVLKALQSGEFSDGSSPLTDRTELEVQFTPWHMIPSLAAADCPAFRIPADGFRCNVMVQLFSNCFILFHEIAFDETQFPDLPRGHSTFSLRSPLAACLCHAIRVLQEPETYTTWDSMVSKGSGYSITHLTLAALCALWQELMVWADTRHTNEHCYSVSPAHQMFRNDVSVLAPESGGQNQKINDRLTDWCRQFRDIISPSGLSLAAYHRWCSLFPVPALCTPTQPTVPNAKCVLDTTLSEAGGGNRQSDKPSRKPSSEQSYSSEPNAISKFTPLTNPLVTVVDSSIINEQTLGQKMSMLRSTYYLAVPKLPNSYICLAFLARLPCRCGNRRKGFRQHINLDDKTEASNWSPAALQPLFDYLNNSETQKFLKPSVFFVSYMSPSSTTKS